ncbi:MAG TPA: undecaprenyl-diphosphate phosphatase [Xanthobacteraceae bacterium]
MAFTWLDLFKACALGMVDGLTEFVPVSATGHLLLAQRLFGFADQDFGRSLAVLIRLGALMGLVSVYFSRLRHLVAGMSSDPAARRFVIGVLLAALPAAVVGALAHDVVEGMLLTIWLVCFAMIVGGAVLLWIDRRDLKPRRHEATGFPLPMCLGIGLAQCLALIPGVSRSGAAIVAAMWLGADRRAAAEFSLWLALPTLAGALGYDLYRGHAQLNLDGDTALLAIGFAAAFVTAWCVVRTFLDYVARRGLALFAWWRVIVGTLGLIALALGR